MVASGASAILTASEVGALPFHPVICHSTHRSTLS